MNEREWNAMRQHKAEVVRAMYVPLEPGQALTFRQNFDDHDGFRSFFPPNWETGDKVGKLRVLSGTPWWGHNVNGKRAVVIRHLPWDEVHPFNKVIERSLDCSDPEDAMVDCHDSEPNFEWYEVECGGQRLYAGRWHMYRTEEELQRDEEANAKLDALTAEFQREQEEANARR
jgi:hypothetical protein